jgi:hypothetical protein
VNILLRVPEADTTTVTVHAKARWIVTLIFLGLGASALVRYGSTGVVLAVLALIPIVVVQRMRLSADAAGVTVVNLLRPNRTPWSEISDFRMGRVALSTCLDVCKRDRSRVHSWVVTTTGRGAYSGTTVDRVISDLRQRLMLANGESPDDLDARAVEDALAAADKGDHAPAAALVAEHRIGAQEMAERLIELSKQQQHSAEAES